MSRSAVSTLMRALGFVAGLCVPDAVDASPGFWSLVRAYSMETPWSQEDLEAPVLLAVGHFERIPTLDELRTFLDGASDFAWSHNQTLIDRLEVTHGVRPVAGMMADGRAVLEGWKP